MADFLGDAFSFGYDVVSRLTGHDPVSKQMEASEQAIQSQMQATQQQLEYLQDAMDKGLIDIDEGYRVAQQLLQQYNEPWAYNKARKYLESPQGPQDIMSLPGVQFQYEQGQKTLENLLSKTTGGGVSGDIMKAAQEYGQGFASTQLDAALNRLSPYVETGYESATNLANLAAKRGLNRAGLRSDLGIASSKLFGDVGNIQAQSLYNRGNLAAEQYAQNKDIFRGGVDLISNIWKAA